MLTTTHSRWNKHALQIFLKLGKMKLDQLPTLFSTTNLIWIKHYFNAIFVQLLQWFQYLKYISSTHIHTLEDDTFLLIVLAINKRFLVIDGRSRRMKLECMASFELFGNIMSMQTVHLAGSLHESILLSFRDAKVSVKLNIVLLCDFRFFFNTSLLI